MGSPSSDSRRPARLFVYGTLMRGERNHRLLAGSRFVGETATGRGFRLVDLGGFPGMVKAGSGSVSGELYEVGAEALGAVDALERHPDFYWRTEIELVDGRTAQAYLLPADHARGAPLLPEGCWRSRSGRLSSPAEASVSAATRRRRRPAIDPTEP